MYTRHRFKKNYKARTGEITINEKVVIKQLYEPSKAQQEYNSIQYLHEVFPGIMHNNWWYKSIKPFKCENGYIMMEKAEGYPIDILLEREPFLSYHIGVWLAYFHKASLSEKEMVLLFGDTTLDNVILDKERKITTLLDPGLSFGKQGFYEQDILGFIFRFCIFALKNLKMPGTFVHPFIQGYFSILNNELSCQNYNYSLKKVYKRYKNMWMNKTPIKRIAYFIYVPFILIYCRLILLNTIKRFEYNN